MAVPTSGDDRSPFTRCAPLVVLSIAIGFFALNYRWMNDNGFFSRPPSNDASWYRRDAYRMSRVLQDDGLWVWLKAGNRLGNSHPPLLPMVTGLFLGLRGRPDAEPRDLFFVSALFGLLMTVGAYRLARSFLPPSSAVLCAFIVAACPGVLCYWRPFDTQLPMAAFITLALDAIVRSQGFTRFRHAALAGIWFALAFQSKMLAPLYLAGPIVVALIAGLVGANRRRAWKGALIAALCAMPGVVFWYPLHFRGVLAYTRMATGEVGQEIYSSQAQASAAARWLYYPRAAINESFGFWVGILVVLALIALSVQLVGRIRARPSLATFDSSGVVVAASSLCAYVPLTLGQAGAGGFFLVPFVPHGALALVCAISRSHSRGVRIALRVVVCLAGLAVAWTALRRLDDDQPGPALGGLVINDRTDSRLGDPARSVGALQRPEAEAWPSAEFVEEMFRANGGPVRYGFPSLLDQPLMTAAVIDYEADRRGIPLSLVDFGGGAPPTTPLGWARCRRADFFVLSSHQARRWKAGGSVPELLEAIRATGVEVEVVDRRAPTPKADLSLIKIVWPRTDTAMAVGRDALADPGVRATKARFANGAVLCGVRGKVLGGGSLVVTSYWEVDRASTKEPLVGIALDLPGDDGKEWRRPIAVAKEDANRQLVAVTSGDLLLPKDAPARVSLRVYDDPAAPRAAAVSAEEGAGPPTNRIVLEFSP